MTDLSKVPLPRVGQGVVTWPALSQWMATVLREIAARQDARNPNSDFASGILANADGSVTVGTEAYPEGRDASVPELVTNLDDDGRAASPDLTWPVYHANRNSVQSISDILIATSGETESEIEVQAHEVKWHDKSVAYASGTVTGLEPETIYYIYTDDADRDGGAVTYLATTNPDNLIEKNRYYVGYIETPVTSSSAVVTAASAANPIEITTQAEHGWASGNEVEFASMPGDYAVLNGNSYVITKTGDYEFTVPVNGSTFGAYTSGGTATRVTTTYQSGGGAGAGVGGGRFDLVVDLL